MHRHGVRLSVRPSVCPVGYIVRVTHRGSINPCGRADRYRCLFCPTARMFLLEKTAVDRGSRSDRPRCRLTARVDHVTHVHRIPDAQRHADRGYRYHEYAVRHHLATPPHFISFDFCSKPDFRSAMRCDTRCYFNVRSKPT